MVDASGVCSSSGGILQAVDLSPDEYDAFREGIAALARKQERRPKDFDQVGVDRKP